MFNQILPSDSWFQRRILNFLRDDVLYYRCLFYEWQSMKFRSRDLQWILIHLDEEVCQFILEPFKETIFNICIILMIICSTILVSWFYSPEVFNYLRIILITMGTVDLLNRCGIFLTLYPSIDVLTVYLIVWQLMGLVWKWSLHEIFSPIVIVEQGLFCMFFSIFSYMCYDSFNRYIPLDIHFLFLWLLTVADW